MSSIRPSWFRKAIIVSGGVFALLLLAIAAALLSHSFIMKQSELVLSRLEFYAIFAIIVLMFVSMLAVLVSFAHTAWSSGFGGSGAALDSAGSLTETVSQLQAQVAFQQKSITALLSISESKGNLLPLHEVFQRALRAVEAVTGFSTIAIRLYDDKRKCLKMAAQQGMSPSMLNELECIQPQGRFEGLAMESLWPVPIKDLAAENPAWVGASPSISGFRSVVCVPLVADQIVIGTMELGSKTIHDWHEDELRWLALVGRSLGIIIHQVRITDRLKGVVIVEERNRLSREIHDGLAQLLSSVRLWAEEARLSAEERQYEQMERAIAKIERAAEDACVSVRQEMLDLRNTALPGQDLLPVLADFLDRFQRQWGIQVRLEIYRDPTDAYHSFLSTEAESQLLRIVQEGLTNIRRHARARTVTMRVSENAEDCDILIEDDGAGFSARDVSGERLGLRIMRERAASVGGHVDISSSVGQGTSLHIVMPKQVLSMADSPLQREEV